MHEVICADPYGVMMPLMLNDYLYVSSRPLSLARPKGRYRMLHPFHGRG